MDDRRVVDEADTPWTVALLAMVLAAECCWLFCDFPSRLVDALALIPVDPHLLLPLVEVAKMTQRHGGPCRCNPKWRGHGGVALAAMAALYSHDAAAGDPPQREIEARKDDLMRQLAICESGRPRRFRTADIRRRRHLCRPFSSQSAR